jgi:hypothetical protein
MVEKDAPIPAQKIKHRGVFDFPEIYRYAYTWYIDQGYDLVEKNYTEKVTARGKEIEIEWVAVRKISDYFRFNIKTNWRILGMTDVEVEENGKKVKVNNGDLEIKFSVTLEKDYEARWEGNPWLKFLRGLYDKYIIRARIDAYEGKLIGEVNEVIAQVKSYLALTGR